MSDENDDNMYTFSSANTNPIFLMYTKEDYSQIFDPIAYFTPITGVGIIPQNSTFIQNSVTPHTNTQLTLPPGISFTPTTTALNTVVSVSFSQGGSRDHTIVDAALNIKTLIENDFSANVINSTGSSSSVKSESSVTSQNPQTSIDTKITYDHVKMKQYMDDYLKAVTLNFFVIAKNMIGSTFTPKLDVNGKDALDPNYNNPNFVKACINFGKLWDSHTQQLYVNIVSSITSFFDSFFTNTMGSEKNVDLRSYITNLGNNHNSTFYFSLRTAIVNNLNKPAQSSSCSLNLSNDDGSDVQLYMYKIIADTFIKIAFPLIQYLFMDCLMKYYMGQGDFINVRLGLIAKLYFIGHMTVQLTYAIQNIIPGSIDNNSLLAAQHEMGDVIAHFTLYINNMNNIDMTPGADQTKELNHIQEQLTTLSRSVAQDSTANITAQHDSQNMRLVVRNIDYNTQIKRRQHKFLKVELIINIIHISIIVLACSILLILQNVIGKNSKPPHELYIHIVYNVAGWSLISVILYKLVMFIFSIMNKN